MLQVPQDMLTVLKCQDMLTVFKCQDMLTVFKPAHNFKGSNRTAPVPRFMA
jgi:hypothetical protein